jgi:dolichol-phosphate mannosyltransferase
MSHVTVVIPTFNEEENITSMIQSIQKLYTSFKNIIADDGSRDSTAKLVKESKAQLLDRSKKKTKGLTAAIIDSCKKIKTRYMVVMDADFQHPPEKIGSIAKKLEQGYDIVIATRKRNLGWPIKRKIISRIAKTLGRIRLILKGYLIIDPVSGFFGIKTSFFKDILARYGYKFENQGYKVLFDILKYSKNAKIAEIYYEFRPRQKGASKIGKKQVISYLRALFK